MAKNIQHVAQMLCLFMAIFHGNSHALESSVQLHKVDQDKSFGYSLSIGDEFFKQKAFNWQVSYNRFENVEISDLDKISVVWDSAGFDFTIQTFSQSTDIRLLSNQEFLSTNSRFRRNWLWK